MPACTTWIPLLTTLVVVAVGFLFSHVRSGRVDGSVHVHISDEATRALDARREAVLGAVAASVTDPAWADIELRDALCDALIRNARAAIAIGALPAVEGANPPWPPDGDVRPGMAYRALRARSHEPFDASLRAHLGDARWGDPAQRGPLCTTLVSLEARQPPS